VDATAPLTSSAQTAGALYNTEADYVDSAGTTTVAAQAGLNPDKGIGIPGTLKVPVGNIGAALAAYERHHQQTGTTTPTTRLDTDDATTTTQFAITSMAYATSHPSATPPATTPTASC